MDSTASGYSSAQVLGAISAALRAGDMEAVAGLVRLLATIDPHEAQIIADFVKLANRPAIGER